MSRRRSTDEHDYFALDQATLDHPYEFFGLVRSESPVWRDPATGTYIVTGYAHITAVTRQPTLFSSTVSTIGPSGIPLASFGDAPAERAAVAMTVPVDLGGTRGDLVRLDPPDHGRLRGLVNRLFTPKRMLELEPAMRRLAGTLIDGMLATGGTDFLAEVARPLTFVSICELLGIPDLDRPELLRLSAIAEKQGTLDGRAIDRERHGTQRPFFEAYIRDRRARPTGDYLSEIANSRVGSGELPSEEDVATLTVTIFGAGLETTMRTLGGMVHHLARTPEVAAALRSDPSQVGRFIEEFMRFRSSVRGVFRYVVADTEIAGVPLSAGSVLYLAYAAGNHDPQEFVDPDIFDTGREVHREHLNFGSGIHYCVGHALARQEIRICLETLLARTTSIAPVPGDDPVPPLPTFLLDTPQRVLIDLDPA